MRSWTAWLPLLRVTALVAGLPCLVYWALQEQALTGASGLNVYLLGGAALSLVAMVLYAARFRLVMRTLGMTLSLRETLHMTMLSLFYFFFVPFSVGGDLTRFVKLRARQEKPVTIAIAIVLDHAAGFAGLVLLAGTMAVLYPPLELSLDPRTVALLALLAVLFLALTVPRLRRSRQLSLRAIAMYAAGSWRVLVVAVGVSLIMHLLFASGVYLGSLGWHIPISWPDVLFVVATSLMFQAIPLNVAGVGATEMAASGLYLAIGLPLPAALLLTSLPVLFRLLAGVIGGVWDLLPARLHA